jgi:uncharacterized protein (TIGR02270 family)
MTRHSVVAVVVEQHVDGLAILWNARRELTTSGHVALRHLARFDRRISAQLDGAVVAGPTGVALSREKLADANPGHVFAAAVIPLESGDYAALDDAIAVVEALPDTATGLKSAFGWVKRERLSAIGRRLLASTSPFRRRVGLAACRLHNLDLGTNLDTYLRDGDSSVRAEALRTVGTLASSNQLPSSSTLYEGEPECRFWAAWSSVLLGDRSGALNVLSATGLVPGLQRERAFRLSIQAMTPTAGHLFLQRMRDEGAQRRWLIQGSGLVGDPAYVPWLINLMSDDELARRAGESFAVITGADLAWLDLERKPPENVEMGPTDDAEDENVAVDPDEGLPWPDAQRIADWWATNDRRFEKGARYFMGAPVTREHCIDVLKNGYQRQRILAANYLCLLDPGTPLFNTSAPAWRQQRWLAKM